MTCAICTVHEHSMKSFPLFKEILLLPYSTKERNNEIHRSDCTRTCTCIQTEKCINMNIQCKYILTLTIDGLLWSSKFLRWPSIPLSSTTCVCSSVPVTILPNVLNEGIYINNKTKQMSTHVVSSDASIW